MTPAEFVQLCTQLRVLGAVEVSSDGFAAKFSERVTIKPAQPPAEPQPEEPPLTEEERRERDYARELGRPWQRGRPSG